MAYFFNLNKFQGFPKKQKQACTRGVGGGGAIKNAILCVQVNQ